MDISRYMDPRLILFLNTTNRNDTLHQMIHQIHQIGIIEDKEIFYQAIMDREKIVSTGIGMGVAIPHAKHSSYDHFFITVGILQKSVDWQGLDAVPVKLVFMIGGPDDKQTEYLQILSSLTQMIKEEKTRKKLFTLQQPHSMIELFQKI